MYSIVKILKSNRKCLLRDNLIFFSTNTCLKQVPRPVLRKQASQTNKAAFRIEPFGWFMLIIPVTSFGLGVWQIQRKTWKENLIAQMNERMVNAPIELPANLDEIKQLEFRPVRVKGTFLHDKEIYMGPRSLIDKLDPSLPKFLNSDRFMINHGYLVITPFKLADRDETILVNRGWVTTNRRNPQTRTEGQVEGVVDVIGILRLNENRPNFSMRNQEGSNLYFYRDLNAMCAETGASPIYLDQTLDFNTPGGPVGGQTRVTLRNEHFSYIITWFTLGAATTYMWYKKYLIKTR